MTSSNKENGFVGLVAVDADQHESFMRSRGAGWNSHPPLPFKQRRHSATVSHTPDG